MWLFRKIYLDYSKEEGFHIVYRKYNLNDFKQFLLLIAASLLFTPPNTKPTFPHLHNHLNPTYLPAFWGINQNLQKVGFGWILVGF